MNGLGKLALEAAGVIVIFAGLEAWAQLRDPCSPLRLRAAERFEDTRSSYRSALEQVRTRWEMQTDLNLLLKGGLE